MAKTKKSKTKKDTPKPVTLVVQDVTEGHKMIITGEKPNG